MIQTKAQLRRLLKTRRAHVPRAQHQAWSRSAQAHLLSSPLWTHARSVALYHPFPSEVSTALLLRAAWADRKRVVLPITPPMGQPLRFVQVHPETPRVPGPMGTQEPPGDSLHVRAEDLDLVILPGLGWDSTGTRMGYGGGYYDRSFATSSAQRIQLAFALQEQPGLPREAHDLPMHGVVTEQGLHFL